MVTKVLIADDLNSINKGVFATLKGMGVSIIDQVQYCDDAYLKVKAALKNNAPYELLITDLSFKSDHRQQHLTSGEALSGLLKKEHPELKIIVYSVEDRLQKVRALMQTHQVDAYVCKGRKGLEELAVAVKSVLENNSYLSPHVAQAINQKRNLEIDDYDIELLNQLANGLLQDEIAAHFKKNNILPSSLSTIEKRLGKLRIQFKAKNATHLVAVAKDLGLI